MMQGPKRWRWAFACAGVSVLICAAGGRSLAQQGVPLVPAPPANVVAAKAYAMLERNCAGCHQAGRLDGPAPSAGIANLLALDEISRDPSLVRPGLPDASRIYNVALTRELHHDAFNDPATAQPSAAETEALRAWIAELVQTVGNRCDGRQTVPPARLGTTVERAVAALTPERARETRFLSLAHLHDACLPDSELEALRRAIPSLVAGLVPADAAEPAGGWASPIDPERLVYAVSLTALGWRADQWNTLIAGYHLKAVMAAATTDHVARATGSSIAVVQADWFAVAVEPFRMHPAGADAVRLWGLTLPQALAHAWRRPADLTRVTADLGLAPGAKLSDLAAWSAMKDRAPAIQLAAGSTVRRSELGLFLTALVVNKAVAAQPSQASQLEIALAADKSVYKAGDTATFSVISNRDCYLTLISVDRHGRATVLFPNELAPDNRIAGGRLVEVPAVAAAYRFRFKDKGRETIVAICSQNHRSPVGVTHDYERLRFTVLGDWQLFLREPPEMRQARRDDAATDTPRPLARPRRRGRPGEVAPEPGGGEPDIQTRTAITIDIE